MNEKISYKADVLGTLCDIYFEPAESFDLNVLSYVYSRILEVYQLEEEGPLYNLVMKFPSDLPVASDNRYRVKCVHKRATPF